jgi:hypothetical protein
VLTICESENYEQKHCFILKLDKASEKQFEINEITFVGCKFYKKIFK